MLHAFSSTLLKAVLYCAGLGRLCSFDVGLAVGAVGLILSPVLYIRLQWHGAPEVMTAFGCECDRVGLGLQ